MKKKILVIDDDDGMRTLITTVLKAKGCETFEADNGDDALVIAREHHPDMIISDVMMANMNGFMLRAELSDDPATADIPVILMTGMATGAGAWEADPSVDYLIKPFIMPDLLALIEKKVPLST